MMVLRQTAVLLALPALSLGLATLETRLGSSTAKESNDQQKAAPDNITTRSNQTKVTKAGKSLTTGEFLRRLQDNRNRASECLPELGGLEKFATPPNSMVKQLEDGGRVFFVGDSVIGHICQLGNPGFCCSSAKPCQGDAPFPSSKMSPHELQLDKLPEYEGKGWQHLFEFKLRHDDKATNNTAYFVAPEVHDEPETVNASVELVIDFMKEKQAASKDVLVLGMIGNHYNHGLAVFQSFVQDLVSRVVNPFPGRVVLLGYSPQHFSGQGHYSSTSHGCGPSAVPSDVDMPRNAFRSAIFLTAVWSGLTNTRARLVDLNEILSPLWSCHRVEGDCTHWKDPVISMQAQLVLDALEKIH